MSWIAAKKTKRVKHKKIMQNLNNVFAKPDSKKYVCFNIFTKDGQNKTCVKSPRPMTLDEAQVYFDALSIGAEY